MAGLLRKCADQPWGRKTATSGPRGAGFLASYVLETLRVRGAKESVVPRSKDYDLVDMQAVRRLYADARPTLVIHLAARVGGIEANRRNPR